MPDIGPTLREARLRAKVDISDVEQATKIRAKYLRALENEEWHLVPGSTFVRSFLRTYAEYLGLDAKGLVEEYRLRHEGPPEVDLTPMGGPRPKERRLRPPAPSRGLVVGMSVLALLGLLILLSFLGDDEGAQDSQATSTVTTERPAQRPDRPRTTAGGATPAPRTVRLRLVPTGDVWVCLQDARRRTLIPGTVINADTAPKRTFASRAFTMTLGNGDVDLRVNGRALSVPERSEPVGYRVTPRGRTELPLGRRPTCAG